jgi:FHA domain
LCRSCAREVAPCDGLIADHIHARIDSTDAEAWIIDGFGGAHAIGVKAAIGRSHDCDLMVLASSVSREHAELEQTETGWTVRDLGSRNGTFINGVRSQGRTVLPARALLKVGDVALWFLAEVAEEPLQRSVMTTGGPGSANGAGSPGHTGHTGGGLMRYQLAHNEVEIGVIVGEDTQAGGALLWRAGGSEVWSERSLAPLEFQLLRVLCVRAYEEAASPLVIRGCMPTKQLARDLPFQSKYANQENVRQVVMRLRSVLTEVGMGGVLAVAPGRGYFLTCSVTAARAQPAGADRLLIPVH